MFKPASAIKVNVSDLSSSSSFYHNFPKVVGLILFIPAWREKRQPEQKGGRKVIFLTLLETEDKLDYLFGFFLFVTFLFLDTIQVFYLMRESLTH